MGSYKKIGLSHETGFIDTAPFVRNTPNLNTVESTFKVEQFNYLPVFVTVNYCRCYKGISAYLSI